MKVAFLTLYEELGASSRVRALQFSGALAANGVEATFWPLLSDGYLTAKYAGRATTCEIAACYMRRLRRWRRLPHAELLWIEKELFPYLPYGIERALLGARPYVLDLDDAIYCRYELASSRLVRALFRGKIDSLMAGAAMVIAGNAYLAQRARAAGQHRVEVLPSVVDLQRYAEPNLDAPALEPSPLRIAWIGSPATVRYLDLVRAPVERLARVRAVELRVIGAEAPRWQGVRAVTVGWSLPGEAEAIGACDVGIMPLPDGPWERGKCGYKLIQYMACGLPVIGSPVGVNSTIIDDGVDGFVAANSAQWEKALNRLAGDPALRLSMGRRGREKVVARYSVQAVAPRLAALLTEAAC